MAGTRNTMTVKQVMKQYVYLVESGKPRVAAEKKWKRQFDTVTFRGEDWRFGWPQHLGNSQNVVMFTDAQKKPFLRLKRGEDWQQLSTKPMTMCKSCGANPGEYHALGCEYEQCPKCKTALHACYCFPALS